MSTNSHEQFEALEQWFWPTSSMLSPVMGSTSLNCSNISTLTTSLSSTTSATLQRRHRHWWKVCWIYNNGNLVYHGLDKHSKAKQIAHQLPLWHDQQLSPLGLERDRCVHNDEQLFSMAKQNSSIKKQDIDLAKEEKKWWTAETSAPQVCLPSTSISLQQKLTQPFTALLKQKAVHKNSISQFFIDYKGAEWRAEQLSYQMPTHDVQMLKQPSNEIKFVRNQQRKAQIKPQLFLNKSAHVCAKCEKQLEIGSHGVKISVQNSGNNNNGYRTVSDDEDNNNGRDNQSVNCCTALYHVDCFTCVQCQQVLVDLRAFLHQNNSANSLYCFRHFIELFKPRCQYCDHLIFDDECTEAEGKVWHIGHFCCTECKRSLGGQQYIMANPNKHADKADKPSPAHINANQQLPYCLTCFDIRFGELCEECGELIGCDVGAISHEGRSWHASNGCFKCNMCAKSLLGKPFLPAFDGKIYCSLLCSQEAIQRNRYRERKKLKEASNNSYANKYDKTHLNNDQLSVESSSLLTPIANLNVNDKRAQQLAVNASDQRKTVNRDDNVCMTNKDGIKLNERKANASSRFGDIVESDSTTQSEKSSESNVTDGNCLLSVLSPNAIRQKNEMKEANKSLNEQMLAYFHQYEQHCNAPNHIIEYMKRQLRQNFSAHNIIGASLEYGSSLSEDERTNQIHVRQTASSIFNNMNSDLNYSQMTSSSSSSRNATPLEPNSINFVKPVKYSPLLINSSSSNETTPLMVNTCDKSMDNRLQSSAQNTTQIKNTKVNCNSINYSQPLIESLYEIKSDNHSSLDQSSNSSSVDNHEKVNYVHRPQTKNISPHMKTVNQTINQTVTQTLSPTVQQSIAQTHQQTSSDTPSTQSTAINSTSSQTTPETHPRTSNKSVTFDPNVKETTGRRVNRKYGYSKSRANRDKERHNWSDNHSCSTCSTCSSSSSEDNFDYESTLERTRNQWYGGTKIQYVSSDRKKKIIANSLEDSAVHNDSCTIS